MADIIVVKQNVAEKVAVNQQAAEKISVNPAPVTVTGILLAPATNTTLGGIIVGDNLSITGNGVLSAQPGGVTGFNNRTGNVSLTSNDVTSALAYMPLAANTPYSNLTFTGASANDPFTFRTSNANATRYIQMASPVWPPTSSNPQNVFVDLSWVVNNVRTNGQTDTYYPFFRLATDRLYPDVNEGSLRLQYNYTPNATSGPYYNSYISISRTKAEFFAQSYTWTDNSILTRSYADTRYAATGNYLTSANLTFANLTGTPTTLAGYGITDGLTSADLTPYLTTSSATATYSVLGHTHSIANVIGLQTTLDAKLQSANFTYANLPDTPAAYSLPTATTSTLGGVKVDGTSVTISNGTLSVSTSYAGLGANNFTGAQNLQDNELIRAKIRDYCETVSSPTISSGTLTLNLETSNIFTVSLNAAISTLTISNPPASGSGGSFTLIFTADGTARAVTWPASIKWAGGTAPTLTSTSGKIDTFAFFTSDGGSTWQGYVGGQNF